MPIEREIRVVGIEDLEVRKDPRAPATLRGYAAVFDALSLPLAGGRYRERIRRGAFTRTLRERKRILALWNHDDGKPLGSTDSGTLRLEEDTRGLRFELTPIDTGVGRDVSELIRSGVVTGVSFGFVVRREAWDDADPKARIRILEDIELLEISPVSWPAYPDTSIDCRSEEAVYKAHLADVERRQATEIAKVIDRRRAEALEENAKLLAQLHALADPERPMPEDVRRELQAYEDEIKRLKNGGR